MSQPTEGVVKRCDSCGSVVSQRRINLYKGMTNALWNVYKWCLIHNKHEFTRKEIEHILGPNEKARFGDWVMFGGLVYKHGKGHYGLNMERCKAFFDGDYAIPIAIWKDPLTGELKPDDYRMVRDIPSLQEQLNKDREFIAVYRHQESLCLQELDG